MPRVMWKGAISFGLVNIPVRMYTATTDKDIHFHMMAPDGHCRLRRKLQCPDTGKEYDFKDTARGFEISPNQYVLMDKQELEQLQPEAGRAIEIEDFISLEEIDPLRYEKAYYLGPGEGGSKPYRLLVEAMQQTGRVGIARFVMRNKQHLAALRVSQGGLCLSTVHWPDEVLALPDVVELPEDAVNKQQLKLATDLINSLTREFNPDDYQNTYRDKLKALIEQKAEGETIALDTEEPEQGAEIIDLMEALKRSLKQNEGGDKKSKAKKSGSSGR